MKNCVINVYNPDLVWMAQIDSVHSLIHRTSWHEISNSELQVSKTAAGVDEIEIGSILVVNNQRDKALIVEDMTTSIDDVYWIYNCIPLKGMLNYRICHPSDTTPFVGRTQSAVMMIIPFNNLVSQTRDKDRYFYDSTFTVNLFGVTGLKEYGDSIDFTVNWDTGYMGDTIVDLAKMHGAGKYPVGWNIYINSSWQYFHMDTYQATNRTIHQTAVNPVVFSDDFGNLKNASYTYSIKDWRNVAYMVWNNGTAETNTPVGNTTHGATKGFRRKEIIIDSSLKTLNEVTNQGRSELNKRPHVQSFSGEIINNENTMTTYNKDWFLGDIVTIQAKSLKQGEIISIDAQITEIEETYSDGEYSITPTFGEGKLSFIQIIKNAIGQR